MLNNFECPKSLFSLGTRRWSPDSCRVVVFSCSPSRHGSIPRCAGSVQSLCVVLARQTFECSKSSFTGVYSCQVTVPRFFQGCLFVILLLLLLLTVVSRRQCGKQVGKGGYHSKYRVLSSIPTMSGAVTLGVTWGRSQSTSNRKPMARWWSIALSQILWGQSNI